MATYQMSDIESAINRIKEIEHRKQKMALLYLILPILLAMVLIFYSGHYIAKSSTQKKEIQKLADDLTLIKKEVEVKEAGAKASEESLNKMVREQGNLAAKHVQEKKDLEQKLKSLQEMAKNQKWGLEILSSDNKKLNNLIDKKKNEILNLQAALAQAQPDAAEALKKQIEEKDKRLKDMHEQVTNYEKQIERIKTELASIDCLRMPVPQRILFQLFGVQ